MSELQIAAIGAVALAVIGAITTSIIQVITLVRLKDTKAVVDNVKVKNEEIHHLVNGNATVMLREIADLKARIAILTGEDTDSASAVSAKTSLDEKVASTMTAIEPK